MQAMVRSARVLFALGLQFAAPVIAAVLVANTALAVLSRAAPQLNILSVAFPVQIGIGLVRARARRFRSSARSITAGRASTTARSTASSARSRGEVR